MGSAYPSLARQSNFGAIGDDPDDLADDVKRRTMAPLESVIRGAQYHFCNPFPMTTYAERTRRVSTGVWTFVPASRFPPALN